MVKDEVRILYMGRGDELDETFIQFMESLGYELWAQGFPMGERELCFLPNEQQDGEQENDGQG